MSRPYWMTRDVLLVSFSAFFADLGYQSAIAVFPVFLVLVLGAPSYEYGVASAIAYGVGSFFGYLGGILSDRFSDKKIAILGNALIPLISLMALTTSVVYAVLLFSGGWWARNFRSPSRRKILVEASTIADRGKVFGFLHALDVGGGMISVIALVVLVLLGYALWFVLLVTMIPLVISTLLLFPTSEDKSRLGPAGAEAAAAPGQPNVSGRTYRGIIVATALYGFSSYSLGFPILTIAQTSTKVAGFGSYAVFLGVSAAAGYYIGSRRWGHIKTLSVGGYLLSGAGTLFLGLCYYFGLTVYWSYLAVAVLGFGLGAIETLEPTIISMVKEGKLGEGMGALAASRSFGVFFANLIMGLLYILSPSASYFYAAAVSVLAGVVVLFYGRGFSPKEPL